MTDNMHRYLTEMDLTIAEAAFLVMLFEHQLYPLEPKPRKHILDLIRGMHEAGHHLLVGSHEAAVPLPPSLERLYMKITYLSTAHAEGIVGYCLGWWAARRNPEPEPVEAPPLEPLLAGATLD